MKATLCVMFARANMRSRKSRTSMSGSSVRSSTSTKTASSASPAPPKPSTTGSPNPRSPASASPYRNTASPPEASISPGMSIRPGASSRCSRRKASASTMPITPTGMFTRKIHGHERKSRITPPMTGPLAGANVVGTTRMPAAFERSCWGKARNTIVCETGIRKPPPSPCSARNRIRLSMFHANAQSADPTVKNPSASTKMSFVPKRSPAQPLTGIATATASR